MVVFGWTAVLKSQFGGKLQGDATATIGCGVGMHF